MFRCALQLMQTAALIFLPDVMHVPPAWSNWILLPFQISTLVGLASAALTMAWLMKRVAPPGEDHGR